MGDLFSELAGLSDRPEPFEHYTAAELWTDEHISRRMLECHLDPDMDVSSRRLEFIEESVDWIVSRFGIGPGISVADFGCGPGLYANRLAGRGAEVTGIDFSARSIDHAQRTAEEEGLTTSYVNRNYLEFETDRRYDLVMMIMCDFCALSPAQRREMLARFHGLLKPGGAMLLDVYSLSAFEKRQEGTACGPNLMDGFWSAEKYFGFRNTFKYSREKVVLDKYTIVEEERTRTIFNWLQYFSPTALKEEIAKAGFRDSELLADVAGTPFDESGDEFAVTAFKREG